MKKAVLSLEGLPRDAWLILGHVAAHYNKCGKTIDRWVADPAVGFPQPKLIRQRKHWTVGQILDFDERNPALKEEAAAEVVA